LVRYLTSRELERLEELEEAALDRGDKRAWREIRELKAQRFAESFQIERLEEERRRRERQEREEALAAAVRRKIQEQERRERAQDEALTRIPSTKREDDAWHWGRIIPRNRVYDPKESRVAFLYWKKRKLAEAGIARDHGDLEEAQRLQAEVACFEGAPPLLTEISLALGQRVPYKPELKWRLGLPLVELPVVFE
jgi:glycerophosphoryl diester phosphodiesterase